MRNLLCELRELEPPQLSSYCSGSTAQGYIQAKEELLEKSVEVAAEQLKEWLSMWLLMRTGFRWNDNDCPCPSWESYLTEKIKDKQQHTKELKEQQERTKKLKEKQERRGGGK